MLFITPIYPKVVPKLGQSYVLLMNRLLL